MWWFFDVEWYQVIGDVVRWQVNDGISNEFWWVDDHVELTTDDDVHVHEIWLRESWGICKKRCKSWNKTGTNKSSN